MMTAEQLIAFEQAVAANFNAGKIRAPVHLAGGNEEQLIRIFKDIRPQDWVLTTWRSHYHCLLKGVPQDILMRDILAGRSITLNYPEYRIVSSAIVGGICPIAVGIAMAIQRKYHVIGSEMVHCFVGDMTSMSGVFIECARYANGHGLPIRFHVEDNNKSVCTPTREVWGHLHAGCQTYYDYELPWPHSGAGKRIEF